jgi:hypothetical protein
MSKIKLFECVQQEMNDRKSERSRGSRNVSLVALCGFTCQRCGIGDSNGAGKGYFWMAIPCSVVDVFVVRVEG